LCPNGCSGHGLCDPSSLSCICNANYTGADCSQGAFCRGNPCQFNGQCTNTDPTDSNSTAGTFGFTCSCPDGFTGPTCSTVWGRTTAAAMSSPLLNGGVAALAGFGYITLWIAIAAVVWLAQRMQEHRTRVLKASGLQGNEADAYVSVAAQLNNNRAGPTAARGAMVNRGVGSATDLNPLAAASAVDAAHAQANERNIAGQLDDPIMLNAFREMFMAESSSQAAAAAAAAAAGGAASTGAGGGRVHRVPSAIAPSLDELTIDSAPPSQPPPSYYDYQPGEQEEQQEPQRELVPSYEAEAVSLIKCESFLRSTPVLFDQLASSPYCDVLIARVCHEVVTTTLLTNHDAIAVLDKRTRQPTRFVDGFIINRFISELAPASVAAKLADVAANPPNALDITVDVHEDQGPRPYMEDRKCIQKHAHELLGLVKINSQNTAFHLFHI